MTREEVHDLMENELKCVQWASTNRCNRDCAKCPLVKDDEKLVQAYGYVIKTLEQEPVLDKIRAEIKGMYRVILKGTPKDDWAVRWNDCIDEVLQIIDKYKAESENI